MKTGTKLFLLIIVVCLVMCFYNLAKPKSSEPEKAIAPLDYSKPVYTTDHAIVCPLSLLSDRRADHDISAVMDMYTSAFTAESKAEKLGCEVWKSGIEVAAKPMDGMAPLVTVNTSAFTVGAHLTNDPEGKMRSEDSNPAPPSKVTPSSLGSVLVATPSRNPIPKGDVVPSNDGFGAVICPDSQTLATYDDAAIEWFASSSGPNASTAKSSVIDSFDGLAKSNGCHYIRPGTSLVSEGGNSVGSLAIVTAQMPEGTTIRGVTFPTMITENQQELTASDQQVQVQSSSPPTDRTATPPKTTPVPVGAVNAWKDPATGLMWTKKDNGVDVTWQEATNYCQNLQTGGQSDWRLPTINELQGIYDSSINAPDRSSGGQAVPWQVKGKLALSAWGEWSSSPGNAPGQAWVFGFGSGKPFSYRFEGLKKPRALCVRGS